MSAMVLSKDSTQSQKRTPILRSSSLYPRQYPVLKVVEFSYKIVVKTKFCIFYQLKI